jgi:hypothetical protein
MRIAFHWSLHGESEYTASGDFIQCRRAARMVSGSIHGTGPIRNFDVHPEGERVVVMKTSDTEMPSFGKVSFIFNFFEELRSKVHGQS